MTEYLHLLASDSLFLRLFGHRDTFLQAMHANLAATERTTDVLLHE